MCDYLIKNYGSGSWDWSDESYFSHRNDIDNLGSDVIDANYVVIK